ncbi:MAG: hypothetical protein M3Z04_19145, partial [Chloroflexota bacterium]|nr:hypothetical protein [Chloroflexota bacterium]
TDPTPALAAFNQAIRINPQSSAAYFERASLYHNYKNDAAQALADINKALTLGPPTAEMYHLRADLEGDLENFTAQLADLDQAVAVAPNETAPYWWRRDYYYWQSHQYDRAVADMSRVIALSNDYSAYQQRSLLYVLLEDYPHAISDAATVVQQEPDRASGYSAQTAIAFSRGDYPAALVAANNALDRAQAYEKLDLQAARGRIYVRLKQYDAAKADLAAVLSANPSHTLGILAQTEWVLAQGRAAESQVALDSCVEHNGGYGACYVLRAAQEAGRGATAAARADLAEAHKRVLFPDERHAADALAATLK